MKIPSSSLVVKGLHQEQTWIVRSWICSHKTELLQWTDLLCFYQGYLYFTFIWACTTNRTSGRKDEQILPWSQDWLCSEGGERWETWARKNNYAQDLGLRGENHPVSLRGVNFGFFDLLRKTKSKMPISLASFLSSIGLLKGFNSMFGISIILRFIFNWRVHLSTCPQRQVRAVGGGGGGP